MINYKLNVQILPKWKDLKTILGHNSTKPSNSIFSCYKNYFYLSRSSVSLKIICDWVKLKKQMKIRIWVPDYFCGETLNSIRNDSQIVIVFYPITQQLIPDYKKCTEIAKEAPPDLFLFVHYFGMYLDVSSAKDFCTRNNSFLIEDCAHVLFPNTTFGKKGDFALFSPHKCFGLSDGAALCLNDSSFCDTDIKWFNSIVNSLPRERAFLYYLKCYVKKVLNINFSSNYSSCEHYDKPNCSARLCRISHISERLLNKIDEKQCRIAKYQRKRNLELFNYLIMQKNLSVKSVNFNQEKDIPYLGVFELLDDKNPEKVIHELLSQGFPLGIWTYLPFELRDRVAPIAKHNSKYFFTIPIQQTINENCILHNFYPKKPRFRISKQVCIKECKDEDLWDRSFKKISKTPITQDWNYGRAKAKADKIKIHRYFIMLDGVEIGLFQVLRKYYFGVFVSRINKGPLLFDNYFSIDNYYISIQYLKKRFSSVIPFRCLILSPFLFYSVENVIILYRLGFLKLHYTNKFTNFINLYLSEVEIRNKLNSKWRNQLKAAEKSNQIMKIGSESFDVLIQLYQKEMAEKGFSGIPILYLQNLYCSSPNNLLLYCSYFGSELLSFDVVYIHGKTATYLVGWENELGRKMYANNFLLYNIILDLKQKGLCFFDLGGLGIISSPSIAKFKLGISDEISEFVGDYFCI